MDEAHARVVREPLAEHLETRPAHLGDRDLGTQRRDVIGERAVTGADLDHPAATVPLELPVDQGPDPLDDALPQGGVAQVRRARVVVVTLTVRELLELSHATGAAHDGLACSRSLVGVSTFTCRKAWPPSTYHGCTSSTRCSVQPSGATTVVRRRKPLTVFCVTTWST